VSDRNSNADDGKSIGTKRQSGDEAGYVIKGSVIWKVGVSRQDLKAARSFFQSARDRWPVLYLPTPATAGDLDLDRWWTGQSDGHTGP